MKTLFCEIMAQKTSEAEIHLQKHRILLPLLADCMKQAAVSGPKKKKNHLCFQLEKIKSKVRGG